MSPAKQTIYFTVVYTPWLFKPLYSFLSDHVPIFGYRRKPYIIICSCILSGCFLAYGFILENKDFQQVQILGVIVSTATCFAEVMVDGITVEMGNLLAERQELQHKQSEKPLTYDSWSSQFDKKLLTSNSPRALIQSEAMSVRSFASILATLSSMGLLLVLKPFHIVVLSTFWALQTIVAAIYLHEEPVKHAEPLKDVNLKKTLQMAFNVKKTSTDNDNSTDNEQTNIDENNENLLQEDESMLQAVQPSSSDDNISINTVNNTDNANSNGNSPSTIKLILLRIKAILAAVILLIRPCMFILITHITPSSTDAFNNFLYSEFEFEPWQYSCMNLQSLVGYFVGALLYWKVFSKYTLKYVFILSGILDVITTIPLLGITLHWYKPLHMSAFWYIQIAMFIDAVFGSVATMPSIILAAESAPKGLKLEATMFTVFSSISNGATIISGIISVAITNAMKIDSDNWDPLVYFMLICTLCNLVPIICLPLLPTKEEARPFVQNTEVINTLTEKLVLLNIYEDAIII